MGTVRSKQRPPFRAEHVGSLLRPDPLRDSILGRKNVSEAQLHAIADESIKNIVATQKEIGLHGITDGEYRRIIFLGGWHTSLEGFEDVEKIPAEKFRPYLPDVSDFVRRGEEIPYSTICTGRIKHVKSFYLDEWNYLKQQVPEGSRGDLKITLITPLWYYTLYRTGEGYPTDVYKNDDEYLADLGKAFRQELDTLYENGCRNVQIDDPYLTGFCDNRVISGFHEDGIDTAELLQKYIAFYNNTLNGRPVDYHVAMHLCRGNYHGSRHFTVGSYDNIARTLFQDAEIDTFYLEYDDERSGGFEPLRFLPPHKNVILGVVSSKTPILEDMEQLKVRVYKAADFVATGSGQTREAALNQLGVSPQCGFASHVLGNALGLADMEAKLRLVRHLADSVWPGQP